MSGHRASRWARPLALGLALSALAVLALQGLWQLVRERQAQAQWADSMEAFREHCKAAEEKIFRSVEGVEGLAWVKRAGTAPSDRYRLDDPFDRGCDFEECIGRLLRVTFGAASNPEEAARHAVGYRYIEAVDPRELLRYRYSAGIGVVHWRSADEIETALRSSGEEPGPAVYGFALQREKIEAFGVRYAITWDDISTPADREYGIAGSALLVFDLQTGEVLGRRIGYTVAARPGRESAGATASPIALQTTCPGLPASGPAPSRRLERRTQDRDFALKVLR